MIGWWPSLVTHKEIFSWWVEIKSIICASEITGPEVLGEPSPIETWIGLGKRQVEILCLRTKEESIKDQAAPQSIMKTKDQKAETVMSGD